MQLSELEYWELAAARFVKSDPEFDWLAEAKSVLEHGRESERFGTDSSRLVEEPFALGWIHQAVGEARRRDLYRAHVQRESKIEGGFDTTQIYTPRWLADFLVRAIDSPHRSFLDPCCGTGQLLLAAFDRLVDLGASIEEAASLVHGSDVDPHVVEIARFQFAQYLRTSVGRERATAIATRQITIGDVFTERPLSDVVATNPPYLGRRAMGKKLKELVDARKPFHQDLFAAVMKRCQEVARQAVAIVAPQTFWFIARHETARREFRTWGSVCDFVLLGPKTFRTLSGEKANAAAFIQRKQGNDTLCWDVRRLSTNAKRERLMSPGPTVNADLFKNVPGEPFVFWWPDSLYKTFKTMETLGDWADVPGGQNKTGKNAEFVKLAVEVEHQKIRKTEAVQSSGPNDATWVAYSKGGRFAPWWGNWDYVVNWSQEARAAYRSGKTSNLLDERYWFRQGLCYSDFSSVGFAARMMPKGCVFDMTGPAIFVPDDDLALLHGLLVVLNSTPVRAIVGGLNPSLHTQVRDVRRIPVPDRDTIRSLSNFGGKLVDATRASDWAQVAMLEREADAIVSAIYDVTPQPQPRHHGAT